MISKTKNKRPAASRELDKFILRLPKGMRDDIAAAARRNNRSMNAEIISQLEISNKIDHRVGEEGIPDFVTPLAQTVLELQPRVEAIEMLLIRVAKHFGIDADLVSKKK